MIPETEHDHLTVVNGGHPSQNNPSQQQVICAPHIKIFKKIKKKQLWPDMMGQLAARHSPQIRDRNRCRGTALKLVFMLPFGTNGTKLAVPSVQLLFQTPRALKDVST